MTLLGILLWTAFIGVVAAAAAYYARRTGRYDALLALFVTLTIVANIVAGKTIQVDLGPFTLFAPGGVLMFGATFLLTDIVNERFGRGETVRMIALAFLAQAALVIFSAVTIYATPAPFFTAQAAFQTVLGAAPRIALAGLLTFLVSETVDAYLFAWFKRRTDGKRLWMRNAFSSLPAMLVDSVLFVILAFYGVAPILPLIVGLTVVKWVVGVVDIPFMYLSRTILYRGKPLP